MNQIPVIKTHPFWQLMRWTFEPVAFLDDCARRYGDCFVAQLGSSSPPLVIVSHPDMIADIFAASNAACFDSGRTQHILKWVMGEYSALVLDGSTHRRHRQLLMPPFHGERMRDYGKLICQIAENVMQPWAPGQAITLLPYMNDITLQVILEAVFGLHEGPRAARLRLLLNRLLNMAASPMLYLIAMIPLLQRDLGEWSPVGRYFKLQKEIDDLLFEEIQSRRGSLDPSRTDVLSLLMMAQDEDGNPMTDQELRDELLTLLLAGHDSSAATLSWAIYHIHRYPQVRERLLAELASLGPNPDPIAVSRLPYLNAVCSESLRLRPSGPAVLARITNVPVRLGRHDVPPHTMLLPCVHLTHHRADVYPNPTQFDPDRFLDRQYAPSEYYPFGGNNRRCIAAAFAVFEMKLVVATLLSKYQLQLGNRPVKAVRRHINIAPGNGVEMEVVGTRSIATPLASVR